MDDLNYHLLTWLEHGHRVFRPAERTEQARRDFQRIAERVHALRNRGWVHFHNNHVSRSAAGECLLIGPCSLAADGRAALGRDRARRDRPAAG